MEALLRVEGGAYANLALPGLLARSGLPPADRHLVTELFYGTTRMRRACDWLVDRFVLRPPDAPTRAALRLGAYQLEFLRTPAHAAVSTTVAVAPPRTRGMVNAVLRRVAQAGHPGEAGAAQGWPGDAVRLSYPDWILERLTADLGTDDALGALAAMDSPAAATARADGYVQDRASQWVAAAVGVGAGDVVVDVCAAPGGKATALAAAGAALVVAADVRPGRARVMMANAARLGLPAAAVAPVVADGTRPPLRAGAVDRVLVDAPCSGLGVLRRRPDARWRIQASDLPELAALQRRLLEAAATLARPGATVAYSVCTLTALETVDVDAWLAEAHPELVALPPPGEPWRPAGRGAQLLPQATGTDGMFLLLLRRDG